jgi:circadian clock protein KaiC
MDANELVRTGIEGLDNILLGGIPKGNTILVQGLVGSGKTVLGLEFIYRGITQFNEPGIVVVFETSPDKIIRDAAGFGWNLEELRQQKKLKIIFTTPQVLEQELRMPDSLLMDTAAEIGAKRIFVDGIGSLFPPLNGGSHTPLTGPGSYRELLQQLLDALNRRNLTVILSHELSTVPESRVTAEMACFLVDTVIQLNRCARNRQSLRSIEIVKSRGQRYDTGEHTLHITENKGLEVFRRVQAPSAFNVDQPSSDKRSVIGNEVLDTLIAGGLFDGSTTMVIGISGVGKTVLGTQLLAEGALLQGKRGLMISLDEHPAQIIRNSETIGLRLKAQIDSGMIHLLFASPQELDVDKHYAEIVRLIEEHDIQRMVIDGMTSFSMALEDPHVYRDFFHALVAYSKQRLMTTFFNYENPEFLGVSTYMPEFPVNSIVDNIILLSIAELNNALHRCITVVKARGSKHDFETREYVIGQGGMKLLPKDVNAAAALPFQDYSSMLSRAPTRLSLPPRINGAATAGDKK